MPRPCISLLCFLFPCSSRVRHPPTGKILTQSEVLLLEKCVHIDAEAWPVPNNIPLDSLRGASLVLLLSDHYPLRRGRRTVCAVCQSAFSYDDAPVAPFVLRGWHGQ